MVTFSTCLGGGLRGGVGRQPGALGLGFDDSKAPQDPCSAWCVCLGCARESKPFCAWYLVLSCRPIFLSHIRLFVRVRCLLGLVAFCSRLGYFHLFFFRLRPFSSRLLTPFSLLSSFSSLVSSSSLSLSGLPFQASPKRKLRNPLSLDPPSLPVSLVPCIGPQWSLDLIGPPALSDATLVLRPGCSFQPPPCPSRG